MEKYESIEHVLENMDKNIVYKTKGPMWKPIGYMVAGAGILGLNALPEWSNTDIAPHFLLLLGWTLLISGLVLLCFSKKHFVCATRKERLKCRELKFDPSERHKLVRIVESGNLRDLTTLKGSLSSALRLRVFSTRDGELCFSQVVAYEAVEHININAARQHTAHEALHLQALKSRRG